MNKQQFDICKQQILRFCYLVTTEDERESQEFLDLYRGLIDEETGETVDAKDDIECMDGWCDQIVVTIQALESPLATQSEIELWKAKVNNIINTASNTTALGVSGVYDLYGALLEVNRSNMTKLPTFSELESWYGENWEEAAIDYIESQGKFCDVRAIVVWDEEDGVDRVVFKGDTDKVKNKVAKPVTFQEPNLTNCVPKHGTVKLTDEQMEELMSKSEQLPDGRLAVTINKQEFDNINKEGS